MDEDEDGDGDGDGDGDEDGDGDDDHLTFWVMMNVVNCAGSHSIMSSAPDHALVIAHAGRYDV